jgi:CubicO group peptidase (beta-lactamase class C family)
VPLIPNGTGQPLTLLNEHGATDWPTDSWPEAPENGVAAQAMIDEVMATQPELHGESLATLVVQGGQIVAEGYGGDATVDTTLISWSMGKSMVQALIGFMVLDGRLAIGDRVGAPEWSSDGDPRTDITIDQMLRMASGLEFTEDYVDAATSHCIEMLFGEGHTNTAAYAASLPRLAKADVLFNYSSGTTNVLSRMLGAMAGGETAMRSWMQSRLFDALGMQSATATFDPAGTFVGSSFVYATARDFARFGLLYGRDGMWGNDRLLPEGWVDYARTPDGVDEEGHLYGAHWWVRPDGRGSFQCQGYETQRIRVVPASDLVVVRLGKTVAPNGVLVDEWLDKLVATFD